MAFKSMHKRSTAQTKYRTNEVPYKRINNEVMEPTSTQEQSLQAYYQQLTPFEQRTCDIARDHLGSSFDLARSNGFIKYQLQIKPK